MKFKKLWSVSVMMIAMAMLAPGASIAATTSAPLPRLASEAGILPTSPFYGIKQFVESVELLFTFSPTARARLYSYLSIVRSAEAAAMIAQHHPNIASSALTQYAQDLRQADALLATLVSHHNAEPTGLTPLMAQAASDGALVAQQIHRKAPHQEAMMASHITLAEMTLSTSGHGHAAVMDKPLSSASATGLTFLASAVASASHATLNQVMELYNQTHRWNAVVQQLHTSLGAVLTALAGQLAATGPSIPITTSNLNPTLATASSQTTSAVPPVATSTSAPSSPPLQSAVPSQHVTPVQKTASLSPSSQSQTPESQSKETQAPEPQNSIIGILSAMSLSQVTVNGTIYPLIANVPITYQDWNLSGQTVPNGSQVKLSLKGGYVAKIKVLRDAVLPPSQTVRGTITSLNPTNLSIGGYTLAVSSSVQVQYHDYRLTYAQVPSGIVAKVTLNANAQVTKIKLESDPALPSGNSWEGTVSVFSSSSITINPYTLNIASGASMTFKGQPYAGNIPPGWLIKVHLNTVGQVIAIQIENGPPSMSASDH